MDDLREKLGKLHGVAWLKPTGVVTIHFDPDTDQAEQAYDAIMVVKDAAMNEPGIVAGYDFARAKVDPLYAETGRIDPNVTVDRAPLGRINEHLSEPAYPDTLNATRWAAAYIVSTMGGEDAIHLTEWFRAAIGAGYKAARPLDPGTIYVSQELTREEERVAAGLSSNFTSPSVPPGSAWQPGDTLAINPVEDAIMPELRESLYDETAAIAEAAGEGMGVACEKPE